MSSCTLSCMRSPVRASLARSGLRRGGHVGRDVRVLGAEVRHQQAQHLGLKLGIGRAPLPHGRDMIAATARGHYFLHALMAQVNLR